MSISSPFLVVPVIVITFLTGILWATGGKADGSTSDEGNHSADGHHAAH